jgi:hypothetical protein
MIKSIKEDLKEMGFNLDEAAMSKIDIAAAAVIEDVYACLTKSFKDNDVPATFQTFTRVLDDMKFEDKIADYIKEQFAKANA